MNEYDVDDEAPKVNAEGHSVWPGFAWANPDPEMADAMRDELSGYTDKDGSWVELIDDTQQVDALFDYLADPKHRFDLDEADYSAKDMAEMFEARCVEYQDWYTIGAQYLEDHYPGLLTDPLTSMEDEHVSQVGSNIGASDHEEERYLWVEADDGRVFCIVRPAYADKTGARE